ncbi:MAG: amidohydrolase family protein [Betaproteobacteria bacterium]|nr:amidohydrolase family protein [Betaproteobacteria bacterium]
MNATSRRRLGPICDTHLHVFGDRRKYALVAQLRSEPPDAPLERFLQEAEAVGVTRMVFDQPSHYGLDNSCILDAIQAVGLDRARAIAAVDADTVTDAELRALDAGGVRGIRVNFGYRSMERAITAQAVEQAKKLAPRAAALGWHLEFLVPNWSLQELIPVLENLPCDFSVGHMGVFPAAKEVGQEGFAEFLELHAKGRCWVKFTGVYRISKLPDYSDIAPLAQAFVANNPQRIVWGTDWPFLSHLDAVTYPQLMDLFESWVPDAANQRKILVDNPAQLFGFAGR